MGVCNCLRTNAIIHDMDTNPKKTREISKKITHLSY